MFILVFKGASERVLISGSTVMKSMKTCREQEEEGAHASTHTVITITIIIITFTHRDQVDANFTFFINCVSINV